MDRVRHLGDSLEGHQEDEVVAAHVADEDFVEGESARVREHRLRHHEDRFVPFVEAVQIVERFEVVEVDVRDREVLIPFEPPLHLALEGEVSGESRQRIDVACDPAAEGDRGDPRPQLVR